MYILNINKICMNLHNLSYDTYYSYIHALLYIHDDV